MSHWRVDIVFGSVDNVGEMSKGLGNIVVVMKMPRAVNACIVHVNAIVVAMEARPAIFTKPSPAFATVRAHLEALTNAQAAFKGHVGTKTKRDEAFKLVLADAKQLQAYVQTLAVADPEHAFVIAGAAMMSVRQTPPRHKPELVVKQLLSGSVKPVAKAVKGGTAYEWQQSFDSKQTWNGFAMTVQASVTVHGIKPGTVVWFRYRVLLRTGWGDWSQAVSHMVT